MLFIVGIALLFVLAGGLFVAMFGEVGLLLAAWLLLLGPALFFVQAGGFSMRETFSLRKPTQGQLVGASLIIAGGTPIAGLISWLQSFFIPLPVEFTEQMAGFLATDDPFRLIWLVFLMAITPAISEEFAFRGILLAGSRNRLGPIPAIVLNGLVFGAFHLSFESVFRFLPTAWLGMLMAAVVWQTRSIWTGVLMHALNNGVIVVLGASPRLQESFTTAIEAPSLLFLPIAAFLLIVGTRILKKEGAEQRLHEELALERLDGREPQSSREGDENETWGGTNSPKGKWQDIGVRNHAPDGEMGGAEQDHPEDSAPDEVERP